jgi:hypothetical protein
LLGSTVSGWSDEPSTGEVEDTAKRCSGLRVKAHSSTQGSAAGSKATPPRPAEETPKRD